MNKVVKAENEKIAAIDSATAAETVADGSHTIIRSSFGTYAG